MKTKFQILNFPQCLINPKLKKEIIGDIYNKHDFVFSYDGEIIVSVRAYGIEFGFGSNAEYLYLDMGKAKILKSLGIHIEPFPEKNCFAMNDEEITEFKEIEKQWYYMNK